ncbi:Lac2 [Trypoxylus dichotomus]
MVKDQSTSASWWQSDSVDAAIDNGKFFSSSHGLLQTHPGGKGSVRYRPGSGSSHRKVFPSSNGFKHLDYRTSPTNELKNNPSLSSPDECARACREGEPPRICYYHFTLEYYTVLGAYQWIAGNAGTHFWHSHTGLQKMDGLYGSIVVRQAPSRDPNSNLYDFDLTTHVMLISDWMHEDAAERFPGRLAVNTGQDPESLLINGKGQFRDPNTGFMTNTPLEVFTITPGRRYRFRMINSFASVCPAQLTIEGHQLTVIATDGEPVHPVEVNTIISFSGERYDYIINADQQPGAYWIQLRGLGECGIRRAQQLAILRYARGPYQPATAAPTYDFGLPQGVVLNPLDARCNDQRTDAICVNQLKNARQIDAGILQERPDVKIFLPFRFFIYTPQDLFQPNTYNRYQGMPCELYVPQQFCNGDNRPPDCGQNCMCTHKIDIPLNAVVEVVLVDEVQQPNLSHPFHLHGQAFNVIGIGRSPDRSVKKINLKHALDLDRQGLLHRQFNLPPGKDTIAVPNNGYVVLRFRAENPGFWLFHCHFLFHIAIGMSLVLQIGTPEDLPPIPPGFPTCGDHLPDINLSVNKI